MKATSSARSASASRWISLLMLVAFTGCASQPPAPMAGSPAPMRDVTPGTRAAAEPVGSASPPLAPLAPPPPGVQTPQDPVPNVVVAMSLDPGLYRCELNRRVVLRRVAPDRQSLVINWAGKDTTLNAVQARTGALRFENVAAGLVWIAIVGKSMLLDSRKGQTLANDCKL